MPRRALAARLAAVLCLSAATRPVHAMKGTAAFLSHDRLRLFDNFCFTRGGGMAQLDGEQTVRAVCAHAAARPAPADLPPPSPPPHPPALPRDVCPQCW